MIALYMKTPALGKEQVRSRKKFLHYFPKGFADAKYFAWERNYKWKAHLEWEVQLNRKTFAALLKAGSYSEIAKRAVRIETQTNLLFSFEKMALRDAVKSSTASKRFAIGLFDLVYGKGAKEQRFNRFVTVLGGLPRKQTRVLTWPLATVFGFIARPDEFIFLKPRVTQMAAKSYGFPFEYESMPNWKTYSGMYAFAERIAQDMTSLKPRDFIDLQSFIWVLGSAEYS
ncbi:MAG TPA: hypothetical protein VGO45_03240 [Bacteroidia bacterium]|nr:hypothetical protein [Bacteroidia bacterium]